ncbi:hypothetical protein GF367_03285, partial [Candidatus Woesearchaeota archaeon]|nr:hypothetical protein [Candidatus Woesearchaeota archaeon]
MRSSVSRRAIIGFTAVVLVLFSTLLLFSPSESPLTAFSAYEQTVYEEYFINQTYYAQDQPFTLQVPTDFPLTKLTVTGTAQGAGTLTLILTNGTNNWTVYQGVLKHPTRITGLVVDEASQNASAEMNVSGNNSEGSPVNVTIEEIVEENESEENLSVESVVEVVNVSVNESINTSVNETEDNLSLDENVNEELNVSVNITENVTINESLNVSVNVSLNETVNVSLNMSENVSVNETLNISVNMTENVSLNLSLNATTNVSVNITVNETNETIIPPINESINVSVNETVNLSVNETVNITVNETINQTVNITLPPLIKQISNFCDESCKLPDIKDATLLIVLDGNLSFTLEQIDYVINQPFAQLQPIPNMTMTVNETVVVEASAYFPEVDGLFFDVPSVDGLVARAVDGNVTITAQQEGIFDFFLYVTDGDSLLQSNEFVITVLPTNASLNETVNMTMNLTNVTLVVPENMTTPMVLGPVVVGQPVRLQRWFTPHTLNNRTVLGVDLPEEAENITFEEWREQARLELEERRLSVYREQRLSSLPSWRQERRELLRERLRERIEERILQRNITFVLNESDTNASYVALYELPGPTQEEKVVDEAKKLVTVSSDYHFENVVAFTNLSQEVPREGITVTWVEQGSVIENVTYIDANGNGLIERISWVIPHLSNQTFTIDITVLNPVEYLKDGDIWTVYFDTIGTANLTVTSTNAYFEEMPDDIVATVDEMEFLDITCDGESLINELLVNNESYDNFSGKPVSFLIPDYSCNGTGTFETLVNIAGYATLKFEFANFNQTITDYAYDPLGKVTAVLNSSNGTNLSSENLTVWISPDTSFSKGDGSDGALTTSVMNTQINNYTY